MGIFERSKKVEDKPVGKDVDEYLEERKKEEAEQDRIKLEVENQEKKASEDAEKYKQQGAPIAPPSPTEPAGMVPPRKERAEKAQEQTEGEAAESKQRHREYEKQKAKDPKFSRFDEEKGEARPFDMKKQVWQRIGSGERNVNPAELTKAFSKDIEDIREGSLTPAQRKAKTEYESKVKDMEFGFVPGRTALEEEFGGMTITPEPKDRTAYEEEYGEKPRGALEEEFGFQGAKEYKPKPAWSEKVSFLSAGAPKTKLSSPYSSMPVQVPASERDVIMRKKKQEPGTLPATYAAITPEQKGMGSRLGISFRGERSGRAKELELESERINREIEKDTSTLGYPRRKALWDKLTQIERERREISEKETIPERIKGTAGPAITQIGLAAKDFGLAAGSGLKKAGTVIGEDIKEKYIETTKPIVINGERLSLEDFRKRQEAEIIKKVHDEQDPARKTGYLQQLASFRTEWRRQHPTLAQQFIKTETPEQRLQKRLGGAYVQKPGYWSSKYNDKTGQWKSEWHPGTMEFRYFRPNYQQKPQGSVGQQVRSFQRAASSYNPIGRSSPASIGPDIGIGSFGPSISSGFGGPDINAGARRGPSMDIGFEGPSLDIFSGGMGGSFGLGQLKAPSFLPGTRQPAQEQVVVANPEQRRRLMQAQAIVQREREQQMKLLQQARQRYTQPQERQTMGPDLIGLARSQEDRPQQGRWPRAPRGYWLGQTGGLYG